MELKLKTNSRLVSGCRMSHYQLFSVLDSLLLLVSGCFCRCSL
jgi:hypothetical protein